VTDRKPNAEAIAAISAHYCIQRDPRHTAKAIAEIGAECAKRLTEGHMLFGASLEAEIFCLAHDWPSLKRSDLAEACAGLSS